MPNKQFVTPLDYEKLTPAERQFAALYGLEALDRALKAGPPTAPPARPTDQPASAVYNIIGKEQRDIEGYKIVTGQAQYTADVYMPDMLFVRVKRSPYPHATVKSIDTSKAEKLPGVVKVLTYKDIPDKLTAGGRSVLASEALMVGEPIVAVAAENETIAEDALNLVDVQYNQLPFVLDAREAMKDGSALVNTALKTNVAGSPFKAQRGDIAKGFADAEVTVEQAVATQEQQHVEMEPHVAVAHWKNDGLQLWVTSQYTHGTAAGVAASFGLNVSKVRVIADFTGGGFGDKAGVAYPYIWLVTLLSKMTGRPVRYELTRMDHFLESTHHYPVFQSVKIGLKKDGTITAIQANSIAQAGSNSPFAGFLAADTLSAARTQYNVPNIDLLGTGVITNTAISGARRAVGEPSGVFALETLMDIAAEKLNMDPVALRLKNINETADPDSKLPWSSNGLRDCIVKGAEAFGWSTRWKGWAQVNKQAGPIKTGVGFVAVACNKGSKSPPMTAVVQIPTDGSIRVIQGATNIGGPQRTTYGMIVAEALGATMDQIYVSPPDTAMTSDTGIVAGSRSTKSVGLAVQAAAMDARQQLLAFAAAKWSTDLKKTVKPEELDVANGLISYKTDSSVKPLTFGQAMASAFVVVDGQQIPSAATIIGRGTIPAETKYAQQTYAAAFYEVEVNIETGVVRVTDALQAHDIGKVINLTGLRNTVEGGAMQGIGFALTEEYIYDKATGVPVSSNLDDYKMLMINNTPKITTLFIESNDAVGPFGAKGVGEPSLIPAATAIANAVYYATGVRQTSLPINPKRLMDALKKA